LDFGDGFFLGEAHVSEDGSVVLYRSLHMRVLVAGCLAERNEDFYNAPGKWLRLFQTVPFMPYLA